MIVFFLDVSLIGEIKDPVKRDRALKAAISDAKEIAEELSSAKICEADGKKFIAELRCKAGFVINLLVDPQGLIAEWRSITCRGCSHRCWENKASFCEGFGIVTSYRIYLWEKAMQQEKTAA